MNPTFDSWFENAKTFTRSDLGYFEQFAQETVTDMALMQPSERLEIVDIMLEKPKFRSVFESQKYKFLELIYKDFLAQEFTLTAYQLYDILHRQHFIFPPQYVYFAFKYVIPNLYNYQSLRTIFDSLLYVLGLQPNLDLFNFVQIENISPYHGELLAMFTPLLYKNQNADLAIFVLIHMGLLAMRPQLISLFMDSKQLAIFDNSCKLYRNIEYASRMTLFEMKDCGIEKLRISLRHLQAASKMDFKSVSNDFPVASTSTVILDDLKKAFTVESIYSNSSMLVKMDRAESFKCLLEITYFADQCLVLYGTVSDPTVTELVNLVYQVYLTKLQPLQNNQEIVILFSTCKALLNKFYGSECLYALLARICTENEITIEVLSVLTVDQPKLIYNMLTVTATSLLESCIASGERSYAYRICEQLLALSASYYSFSATALYALITILQDSRFSAVLYLLLYNSQAIDQFLYAAGLVVYRQPTDSHVYFRLLVLRFLPLLAKEKLSLDMTASLLEISVFYLSTHQGDIDYFFVSVFRSRIADSAAAFFELRRLPFGKICQYLDEAQPFAALLLPCDLLQSNLKRTKIAAFLTLTEMSKLPYLQEIRCDLVKLAILEMEKPQKSCDNFMALAVVQELPYLAQFDHAYALSLLKTYEKLVGNEANFQQGKQIVDRVRADIGAAKQIAKLANYVNVEVLKNSIYYRSDVIVDAKAILHMSNVQYAK